MSKTGEYFREQEALSPDEPMDEDYQFSNCCGEPFGPPGWPDCDICSACGEHSDIGGDDD